jgi:ABC-type nitrate/sulfonate/bicarbonate transport system substrate-binding protein
MEARRSHCWFVTFLIITSLLNVVAEAGQRDLQKLTVGYTPISGAAIPFFIAVEERIFQKYGF